MSNISLRPSREQTIAATRILDRFLQPSPLTQESGFSRMIQADVFVKYEFLNLVKSFKIRGALNFVSKIASSQEISRIITVSTGNHGAAMAFACQQYKIPLTIGVPIGCDQSKVKLIRQFGAELEFIGHDLDETKEIFRNRPFSEGAIFVEDGSCPEIFAGTSTIGWEIIQQLPKTEVVIVPIGNGALIGGIGTVLKEFNPSIRVIGVQSEQAPCMALSFQAGLPINTNSCDTFASGMAVRMAIPEAVTLMLEVVDEIVLVSELELKRSMGLFYCHTEYLLEGAGAAALAGALKMKTFLKNKHVCLICSGANIDQDLQEEILQEYT